VGNQEAIPYSNIRDNNAQRPKTARYLKQTVTQLAAKLRAIIKFKGEERSEAKASTERETGFNQGHGSSDNIKAYPKTGIVNITQPRDLTASRGPFHGPQMRRRSFHSSCTPLATKGNSPKPLPKNTHFFNAKDTGVPKSERIANPSMSVDK